ncbi:MAG: type II secretion system GspH family protein [Endomicrobium sp.]|jgi:prepilin-type N-terminal cleavage/methylation domain-containing protein|nr:type II secretion system GspH family protein [Endomicrobium sp.]
MFKANSAKGLTLVEVLVSIVITGIILTAMFPFFARIQRRQVLASSESVLFQGALASFETRRLHTLSRNFSDNTLTAHTPGATTMSRKISTLFESLRNEIGYYAMSKDEIMPFAVVHSFRGPAIDWIYGNYITCTALANGYYRSSEKSPQYTADPELGYHRVFLFTSEVVGFVSLTQSEARNKLATNFITGSPGNSSAVDKAVTLANTTGFGRVRSYDLFGGNSKAEGNVTAETFKGVPSMINALNKVISLNGQPGYQNKNTKLLRIKTHHVSGIYEWPDESNGHV